MARPDHNILPARDWSDKGACSDQEDWSGKKIGLLGGSFNPAHAAHLEISLVALEKLQLDAVWWLVSPQNPLKSADGMAPLEARMESAQGIATDPRIFVTDLENRLGTRYSVDTVERIISHWPDSHFVWLMGADNLAQFSKWKGWKKIARTITFAIFDRPGYSDAARTGDAANCFRDDQIPPAQAARLVMKRPPAWVFIRDVENPLSSTELRRKKLY